MEDLPNQQSPEKAVRTPRQRHKRLEATTAGSSVERVPVTAQQRMSSFELGQHAGQIKIHSGSQRGSRTIAAKASKTAVQLKGTIDDAHDAYNSGPSPGKLFKANRETLDTMLIRKLRQKYIDDNEAFSKLVMADQIITADENTASILQNNFKANYGKGRTRSTASNLSSMQYK